MPRLTEQELQDIYRYLEADKPLPEKDRSLELKSVFHEVTPGRRKIAVKVVDIFGNDTMTILDINVVGKK
ncbi:MAG: hypothetical protein CVU41_12320 [Chloroflexi bacterium HGW-Chloroflexi-3]|nr:MAG: hypothetical protein CVU41_12320 [Chloroflexi bacterium HGW-Chloroflexi-3]